MFPDLVLANVVIAGTNFNPSVFSQLWLLQNGIVNEDEFDTGSAFTDFVVQVQTKRFALLALPQQITLTPRDPVGAGTLVCDRLQRIIRLLPHTPFAAVGMNFVWASKPVASLATSRQLFAGASPLYEQFSSADARFGAYMSKDLGTTRLRLDARPIHTKPPLERVETFQFAFNIERDLQAASDKVAAIVEVLSQWDANHALTRELTEIAIKDLQ